MIDEKSEKKRKDQTAQKGGSRNKKDNERKNSNFGHGTMADMLSKIRL
jgi:hypothetical protein